VQVSLDGLEEMAEDIQRELVESDPTAGEAQNADNWEEVAEALDDVDEQLDSIGQDLEDLNEVAFALEGQAEATPVASEGDDQLTIFQDQVDQVFTIFAILVGIASIAIAILLGLALRIQHSASHTERT